MLGEIVSIGDELLIGQVINTNASWIASRLNDAGIRVVRITAVPDEHHRIVEALEEASGRSGLIIMTGGLGPTRDDITKQTLCEYFHSRLIFDQSVFDHITKLFEGRGMAFNNLNRNQALVPEGCTVLPNRNGTAPGMWFEKEGRIYVSLPGVPFEMKPLITGVVIPKIQTLFPHIGALVHRTVFTQGIPESVLADSIAHWEDSLPANIKLAYLPRAGMVRLRLSGSGSSKAMLNEQIDEALSRLDLILPGEVFGADEENLEAIIGRLLISINKTLCTAESCTGGYIAHLITSVPGSSEYFNGSVIAYSNAIKEKLLGVEQALLAEYRAVSEPVVKAMAEGARKQMDSDYAIATTGIAGPGGGSAEKPVGTTWIAVSTPERTITEKHMFGKNRERNIHRATYTALNMLRKELGCLNPE